MPEKFDIVIAGAGPAGSTCALALANSGLKIAILEKSQFPRDKVCGDAVAPYVSKIFNSINPSLVKALEGFLDRENVNTMRVVAPNKKCLDLKFNEEGFISKRIGFDRFLFEQVAKLPNVTVFLNASVQNVTVNENAVNIDTAAIKLESALLIGCDGANSLIRKTLTDYKVDLKHHIGAVRAYYKNVSNIPEKTFEIHFLKDLLPAYFWIFPLPDNQANVGFGMLSSAISKRKINLRDKMKEILKTEPYIKDRFKHAEIIGKIEGYGLPLGSRKTTISGERFMLCGDAASLIDPISGEGIGQAIASGRYAGWHALKCFEQNNFSASYMKKYDKIVYDKFWKSHRKSYLAQRIINERAWPINLVVNFGENKTIYNLIKKFISF